MVCYNTSGDYMDRNNIDKIARTPDDKLLLAKIWDKINTGIQRNTPAATCFLSPRELELSKYLFGNLSGLYSFGGYGDAERKVLSYLPEYLDTDYFYQQNAPLVCIQADYYNGEVLTHRDFLGALMGSGIARETIGDICVGTNSCYFFVTGEIAPYILQNFTNVGKTSVKLKAIPLDQVNMPAPNTKDICDTLASLRLDSVIASGFRIGRSVAAQYVTTGRTAIDGLPCEKPDKPVSEGCKISIRGLGKICLYAVKGQTKKGRISVIIKRYI